MREISDFPEIFTMFEVGTTIKIMEEKNKKLIGDVVTSALFIIAGIVIAVVTSSTIVRICGAAVAVIEVFSVIRQFVKWRTGDGNKE